MSWRNPLTGPAEPLMILGVEVTAALYVWGRQPAHARRPRAEDMGPAAVAYRGLLQRPCSHPDRPRHAA